MSYLTTPGGSMPWCGHLGKMHYQGQRDLKSQTFSNSEGFITLLIATIHFAPDLSALPLREWNYACGVLWCFCIQAVHGEQCSVWEHENLQLTGASELSPGNPLRQSPQPADISVQCRVCQNEWLVSVQVSVLSQLCDRSLSLSVWSPGPLTTLLYCGASDQEKCILRSSACSSWQDPSL